MEVNNDKVQNGLAIYNRIAEPILWIGFFWWAYTNLTQKDEKKRKECRTLVGVIFFVLFMHSFGSELIIKAIKTDTGQKVIEAGLDIKDAIKKERDSK